MRRGRPDGRKNGFLPFLVAFSDDRLVKAVALPERSLILRIGSAWRGNSDANDPFLSARFRNRDTVAWETYSR